jgi:hypothetical protein
MGFLDTSLRTFTPVIRAIAQQEVSAANGTGAMKRIVNYFRQWNAQNVSFSTGEFQVPQIGLQYLSFTFSVLYDSRLLGKMKPDFLGV